MINYMNADMSNSFIIGFIERDSTIIEFCRDYKVLLLACVGFADCAPEQKVKLANSSLHQALTENSADCVGVDSDGRREWPHS